MEEIVFKVYYYKISLKETMRDLFGEHQSSDKWKLLVKALDEDFYKRKTFRFVHPKSNTPFYRHYKEDPAYGNVHLVVGQFRAPLDFVDVWILLNSVYYKVPYLAIGRCDGIFRNPDTLAEMVEKAFNWVLQGSGLKVEIERWYPQDLPVEMCTDYQASHDYWLRKTKGVNLIEMGYEDSHEEYHKKKSKKRETVIRSEKMVDHIKKGDKAKILKMVHERIKGKTGPKDICMPVRFLRDHDFLYHDRLPYKAFLNECPEALGLVSKTRYNHWTNNIDVSYEDDPGYRKLRKEIDDLF